MPTGGRRRRLVALAALLLAGAFAAVSGCARAGDSGSAGAPASSAPAAVPLAAFVAEVAGARYADYAGKSGVAVRDEPPFEEMRRYLIGRYQGADVARSIASGGVVFDCLRQSGRVTRPPAPVDAPSAPPLDTAPPGTTPPDSAAAAPGGGCPDGSVAVRRVTLDELVRFPTLSAFLGKGPAGEGLPPTG